ncbi:uncharacterized protein LOC110985896 [Acanthaster planci]|uniref:Uncharacterized protein LOC110985896 n=1 Tax=Acanthaster planci TaxID=133434 RepID=A0A8B7ZBK7_ACAPL|nr:uncharacterized protein LOC110985896 [Acanthaster planci]
MDILKGKTIDQGLESPQEFAHRIMKMINSATMTVALSLGVETGLLKIMGGLQEPSTSSQIAQMAGLKERYVREWLGAMVVGRIVDVDPTENTYYVPPERRPFLVDGPMNVVAFSRLIPMLCEAYDDVADCFRRDGPAGVSYSKYGKFHQFMDHMSNMLHNTTLIPDVVPSIPGLMPKLESGCECLDVGCGRGRAILLLAQRFPRSIFYGIDISDEAIAFARNEAQRLSLSNCHFIIKDAASLPGQWVEQFGFITCFDAMHDMAHPRIVLNGAHRALAPGGIYCMLELNVHSHPSKNVGNPRAIDGYVISLMHCMPVSLSFEDGAGLGTMWGREMAVKMLEEVGFTDVTMTPSKDKFNLIYVAKKKTE